MPRLIQSRYAKLALALLGCGGLLIATIASVGQTRNPIGIVAPLPQGDVVMRYVVRWYDEELQCWKESIVEVYRPEMLHPTEQQLGLHARHAPGDAHPK